MQIAEARAPVVATPMVAISPGAITEYVGQLEAAVPPRPPGDVPSLSKIAARVACAAKSGTGGTRIR